MRNIALILVVVLGLAGGYAVLSVQAEDKSAAEAANVSPAADASADTVAVAGKSLTISVVDIEQILTESKAAKSLKEQVDEKRKGFLAEVEKVEDELRASMKAIEKDSKTMKKEELMKKAQEFEKKRMDARKDIQAKKSKLDKAYTDAMNDLTKTIFEVCQKIAAERRIDLVITRQNIIVGSMSLDITADVLKNLDSALPTVQLTVK